MKRIDIETAQSLIDFSGKKEHLKELASQQLKGTVALHNILAKEKVAYLADEVGMGKTYIALGIVALMRKAKPNLRVLYLLPKANVRDKWVKDYKSFIEYNIVKATDHSPAANYQIIRHLTELIEHVDNDAKADKVQDYFICTSLFSLALGNSKDELRASLRKLVDLLPNSEKSANKLTETLANISSNVKDADKNYTSDLVNIKGDIKEAWASALNGILPIFDLIVVDEAHNLRHSKNSSDRNLFLAKLFGSGRPHKCNICISKSENQAKYKVSRTLLLSATPFDRDSSHLVNQLAIFGKTMEIPESKEERDAVLKTFMIRRLNELKINGERYTRNMYRQEHRSGVDVEISLAPEQALFSALLQKKISESLNERCDGKFELGLLASFESYFPTSKSQEIKFDGRENKNNTADSDKRIAPDKNIIQYLIEDYYKTFNSTPPHPKMDDVVKKCHAKYFARKKQLIFVRRINSVSELKAKFDSQYDHWIETYIGKDEAVSAAYKHYSKLKPQTDLSQSIDDSNQQFDDKEESISSGFANFFTWFYRGKNEILNDTSLKILPITLKNFLRDKSLIFEINWAKLPIMPASSSLVINWDLAVVKTPISSKPQSRFQHLQYAYLLAVKNSSTDPEAQELAKVILSVLDFKPTLNLQNSNNSNDLINQYALNEIDLNQPTLWNFFENNSELNENNKLSDLGLTICEDLPLVKNDAPAIRRVIQRTIVHKELVALLCRIDHPFIDLYGLRRKLNKLGIKTDEQNFLHAIINLLLNQQENTGFNTYHILKDVAQNLDLIIKLNLEDVYDKSVKELITYMSNQLSPLTPIIGASGDVAQNNRSAISRKFRMPGYPQVLISTDVFQEGEDLHTFCDSVVHYGISASPIALEQKVGRVDRIGSMAHRAISKSGLQFEQHFIQVSYPHIRQSLEFLQVRHAAKNLNEFHLSLNLVGESESHFNTSVSIKDQLTIADPIPQLIKQYLTSPFTVEDTQLLGECNNHPKLDLNIDQPPKLLNLSKNHLMCLIRKKLNIGSFTHEQLLTELCIELAGENYLCDEDCEISLKADSSIRAAKRRQVIETKDNCLNLVFSKIEDYSKDHLKTQFLASLSSLKTRHVDRSVAIRAFARWMGYAKTGSVITKVSNTLIKGLLIQGRLEANGQKIKRI